MRKPFFWAERKAWYLRIQVDGKLKTVRLATTKTDAYDEWDRMKIAAQAPVTQSLTVETLIAEYTAHMRQEAKLGRIAATTVTRQIAHIAPFLAAYQALTVDDLKPHHVTTWLRSQTTWNATTQSDAAAAVKRVIQWACDQGRIQSNPIEKLKVAKGTARDHVVSRDEYEKLLTGVCGKKYRTRQRTAFRQLLIALRLSGCRPSEITTIQIADSSGDRWTIREHKNRKKKIKPRVVYLSPCLQTLTRITARGRKAGPLFLAAADRGWKYSDMRLRFQRLRDKTGTTKKCVLYSFRHTWITEALLAGVDVATVAEMAGTSIQMIDRHYGHLCQHRQHLSDAASKVAAARFSK